MSLKDYLGYEDSLLPKLATGFGGGIGRRGSICGALSGSVMALGMKFGRTDPNDKETVTRLYEKCRQFWDRFEKEFGNVHCLHITGFLLEKPEELKKHLEAGGKAKCGELLEKTAWMVCNFIEGIS